MGLFKQTLRKLKKSRNTRKFEKVLSTIKYRNSKEKFIFFRQQNIQFSAGDGEQKACFPAGAGAGKILETLFRKLYELF